MTLDARRLDQLVCPVTRTRLRYDAAAQELVSGGGRPRISDPPASPVMLVEEARKWSCEREAEYDLTGQWSGIYNYPALYPPNTFEA